jgi:RNA polymerase-interacting CarD/CdnL/TRCF family regulator
MQFKIGDTVVEPSIGICKVEGIRRMNADGAMTEFYVFHAPNNTTVLVPRSQIEKRGVRKPMEKDEIKKVIASLKVPTTPSRTDARLQYTTYREVMNSGDPMKISKLLRDLYTLDQSNELKGKEREIMEQARKFLSDEIQHVRDDAKNKVADEITEALKQMYKKKVQKDREARKKSAAAS